MAFSELTVHRALQPWRTAGLSLWLCADEAHAQRVRHPVAAPVPPRSQPAADANRPAASPAVAPARPAAAPEAASAASQAKPAVSQAARTPSRAPQAPAPVRSPAPQDALAAHVRPEAAWPEAWRALLARSPQAVAGRRARIVWSYPALRDDYGGRADPARRAMLQQLLRDLALPSGSHAFWPQTPPPYADPQTVEADPAGASAQAAAFFHSGIEALNPLVVVLFGAPEAGLQLPALVPLVPDMILGRTFVRVQDVDLLAAPFAQGSARSGHLPHLGLVQFLKSQFSALFIS